MFQNLFQKAQKPNDYTDPKYYAEVDSLELNPSELKEYCETAKAVGTKPENVSDPKRRTALVEYLRTKP